MRTAQVSELKGRLDELIDAVKNGESVELREGDTSLAQVVPCAEVGCRQEPRLADLPTARPDQTALYAHLDELVRQGKAHRGTGKLPDDFFTRPRPKLEGGSVLEQLLRDRQED
jgi:antitoxin (DNA-binding transcriptional repressor) of toxin-antitoxin stability system